jgi:hypothetical protein
MKADRAELALKALTTSERWEGLACPDHSLPSSDDVAVLFQPSQLEYSGCACVSPWFNFNQRTFLRTPALKCTLEAEKLHALANPLVPLPSSGNLIYDPDRTWLCAVIFLPAAILGLLALLLSIVIHVSRFQALEGSKGKISAVLPGMAYCWYLGHHGGVGMILTAPIVPLVQG